MDYVFLCDNLLESPVTSVDGLIHFNINTTKPAKKLGPVTRIEQTKNTPVARLTREEFKRFPKIFENVATIEWKSVVMPTIVHSKFLQEEGGKGVDARRFLKRRHALSMSDRYQFFVGNDGVKYRWKATMNHGCTLTRVNDGRPVAYSSENNIYEGIFRGQSKWVLHVLPENLTLDVSMILMTFLIVDHTRQEKKFGRFSWAPYHQEENSNLEDIVSD